MEHALGGSLEREYCVPQVVQIHGIRLSLVVWSESTWTEREKAANIREDFKKSRRLILPAPLKQCCMHSTSYNFILRNII
jgi:hypothetical protein